ncbi:MAG: dTMP kinase [Anaerolineales bacterium]
MFISLEGPEGAGKTSHIPALVAFLRERGLQVFATREPGGTSIGEQIREVLGNLKNTEMNPRTEILLFQAARAQIVEEVLRPRLAAGEVVICDRYADSTLAYQGYGHRMDLAELRRVVTFATGGLTPALTILLDLDVETGLQRKARQQEWNRLDAYTVDFHRRVRAGYLELAAQEPARWKIIDAAQPWEAAQAEIRQTVMKVLNTVRGANL